MTIPNGYHDVSPGKLANVATYLEMKSPPALRPDPPGLTCTFERVESPDLAWHRSLFQRVGEPYLWSSRLSIGDAELQRILQDPGVEVYVLRAGEDADSSSWASASRASARSDSSACSIAWSVPARGAT